MNRCPITYALCGDQKYSEKGLQFLSKSLNELNDFPYTPLEQIRMASEFATKLSVQGVQPKLSVSLNASKKQFEVVEKKGKFIIKPPQVQYVQVPENEDVTMRLAKEAGIEVPLHGMVYNIDHSKSYFIKRFDRSGSRKIAVEDFSQLMGVSRETKDESSMEKVAAVIEKHATFPLVEKIKLFRLTIFNFLVGNEDMHLKNFSLIRREGKVELSPAYDLLNTTLLISAKEEIALPVRGKKSNLKRQDLVDYFGKERLKIAEVVIEEELLRFEKAIPEWYNTLKNTFLEEDLQKKYQKLIGERWQLLSCA